MHKHQPQENEAPGEAIRGGQGTHAAQRPPERPTIHYTELPEDSSGGRTATEWNYYRREVGRLLAEGHEGKWVLIKGEDIVGIWDSRGAADDVLLQRFPMQDVLVHQIRAREPVLRGPSCVRLCRS